jgi:putative transposase
LRISTQSLMADKYQNKYRIQSARLPSWDYSSNAVYFITICTNNREYFFGEIIDGKMQLSEPGKIANRFWLEIPDHFPFVILDEFVVMPNHIHGIIVINKPVDNNNVDNVGSNVAGNGTENVAGNVTNVETGHALSLRRQQQRRQEQQSSQPNQSPQSGEPNNPDQIKPQRHPRFRNQGKNTISAMIGSFKSAVTKCCNENKLSFSWQSRFHDHIIRDNDEFIRIRNYIINNPVNWKEDKFYNPLPDS